MALNEIQKDISDDGKARSINLRMPSDVHQQIKAKANKEQKSITLVIVELLEKRLREEQSANGST